MNFSIVPLSESSLVLQFEERIDKSILEKVLSLKTHLDKLNFEGFIESVPTYCTLTVYYDSWIVKAKHQSDRSPFKIVSMTLLELGASINESSTINSTHHIIPVCYDERCGLDIKELSFSNRISTEEIVSLHCNQEYLVYVIGFTPGFPYMGTVPKQLECKRKESPRKKVPAGSVAIAGKQTGIYPFDSPGGWQIIGRTPIKLFNADLEQPTLLKAGDTVKFESISFQEFESLKSS